MDAGVQVGDQPGQQTRQLLLDDLAPLRPSLSDGGVVLNGLLKLVVGHRPLPFAGGLCGRLSAVPGKGDSERRAIGTIDLVDG